GLMSAGLVGTQRPGAPDSSESDASSVRGDPLACGALRRRDLRRGHFGGDLPAQPDGILVAAHRCELEPFVRGDEIDPNRSAARAGAAELEESAAGVLARPVPVPENAWITLHVDLPSGRGCRDSECVLLNARADGAHMRWITPVRDCTNRYPAA